jgi:hypothetical protein
MRQTDGSPHVLGTVESTGEDLGLGVSALAVRRVINSSPDQVEVWFATIAYPDPRPVAYTNPTGILTDVELGTGAVHKVTWTRGQAPNGFTGLTTRVLHPTQSASRGAAAPVGMVLADLLANPGEELVVGTLTGDIIIYNADTMAEIWRTHVHGAAGCYGSMRVCDLNNDGYPELYIGGSSGLWRLVHPTEVNPW